VAPQLPSKRDIRLEAGDFVARLALTEEERMAAYRLALSGVQSGDE